MTGIHVRISTDADEWPDGLEAHCPSCSWCGRTPPCFRFSLNLADIARRTDYICVSGRPAPGTNPVLNGVVACPACGARMRAEPDAIDASCPACGQVVPNGFPCPICGGLCELVSPG